jgi:outer membrane biogenesis lipoprotein LolB
VVRLTGKVLVALACLVLPACKRAADPAKTIEAASREQLKAQGNPQS